MKDIPTLGRRRWQGGQAHYADVGRSREGGRHLLYGRQATVSMEIFLSQACLQEDLGID
ncbi:hypothetical protein D3C84_1241290 [compost metagenome]